MQTVLIRKRASRARRTLISAALLACTGAGTGCLTPRAVVVEELLTPVALSKAWLPSDSDLAAATLVRAALAGQPAGTDTHAKKAPPINEVETALDHLIQSADAEDKKRLLPLAHDLRNAALDDPIAYRAASRELRRGRRLDPRLRNRLDRTIADDPLRLARRRQLDDWKLLWARTFNSLSEPLGSSAITGFAIAPFQLANSLVHYLASFSNREPISAFGRQSLRLRQDFLSAHPETSLTSKIQKLIDRDEIKLEKTLSIRALRAGEAALELGRPSLAAYHAEDASRLLAPRPDEHGRLRRRSEKIAAQSHNQLARAQEARKRSLSAIPTEPGLARADANLAATLLSKDFDFEHLQDVATQYRADGGGEDRVEFIHALLQHEARFENEARERLVRLANQKNNEAPMARHARQLLEDEWQNPYRTFERLRRKAKRDELAYRLAGEWVTRPRYPNLPAPVAYLVDAPTIAITLVLAPIRSLLSPFSGGPDFRRAAALAGYRYLGRFPSGTQQRKVIQWLFDYEVRQNRPGRALRLADLMPGFDAQRRAELVAETAQSRLDSVARLDRRDHRTSVLKGIAREFPDSEQGREAGLQARKETQDASPQHIQITREFLLENPEVANSEGIGLNPALMNGVSGDGELHPDGVVLRGGRMLEIRLIAEGENDKAQPESRWRKIGPERLAQIAGQLDAAVHQNSLTDLDARQAPDAQRDVYLERAGLGLTQEADLRPTAESSFVYRSLRERYGLVRGRDSLLPFELVFRGSLGDFSLGAFPRWHAPRETPNAFLYR